MLGLYLLVKEDIKETLIKEHEKTNKPEEKKGYHYQQKSIPLFIQSSNHKKILIKKLQQCRVFR